MRLFISVVGSAVLAFLLWLGEEKPFQGLSLLALAGCLYLCFLLVIAELFGGRPGAKKAAADMAGAGKWLVMCFIVFGVISLNITEQQLSPALCWGVFAVGSIFGLVLQLRYLNQK
jgi:hypothetical protein